MSKSHITDFIRNNPQGLVIAEFMEASEDYLGLPHVYLGLHHGDTTSHPYAHNGHHVHHVVAEVAAEVKEVVADVKAAFVTVAHAVKESVGTAQPPQNWHAAYCLKKFGKTTPGF